MGQSSTKAGVVVWGSSEHGQLGIGSLPAEDRAVQPRIVEQLRSVHVRQVACAGHYSCGVSENGEVYTWGYGKDGQLGQGETKDVHTPKAVRTLQSKLIRHVSCAEHHVAAVSDSGILFTWGKGQNGRLGHGGTESELLPKAVEALAGHHVSQVSCGDFHTACMLLNPPHVYTWGLGLSGRLGHGDESDRNLPTLVEALAAAHVTHVACGGHHSATIHDASGQLFTWGGGAFGKLGHGNRLAQTTPKVVAALQSRKLVQVSLGPHHSAALTQKGEVFTWGQAGRLGHASQGAEVDEMVPRQVMALSSVFVLQVSCGHSHCAVVTETGDVWAWGSSRAFGHTEPSAVPNVPTMIKVLSGKAIVQVACGVTHSIALSDYRRLTGKAALAATRSMGAAAGVKDGVPPRTTAGGRLEADGGVDAKKPERYLDVGEASLSLLSGDERSQGVLLAELHDNAEGGAEKGPFGGKGLPPPTVEREIAFLSAELKAYQEQTLRLAKLLQETKTKLEALQNENSFLKSELEVMHQCSNDADERLDTLRRHFNERIREMERRYTEKERVWKETFGRLRSHLDLGAMDPTEAPGMGLGPDFAIARRPGTAPGGPGRADGQGPALADPAALAEGGAIGLPGEEVAGHGAPGAEPLLPTGTDGAGARSEAQQRMRAAGRVSLWPGGGQS
uniref:RCC1-like domain-containing protein n=1 Tax=Alexandrium monilatum TaxID=311494 RepID=A0A7S4PZY7_9DINO|mmetsp:Transcript_59404/g.184318  ORF Transcript_59404/g.184318 Transcript_59404/m.184318 type:complete len:675 (+) Transcript_59404:47-2071(+)